MQAHTEGTSVASSLLPPSRDGAWGHQQLPTKALESHTRPPMALRTHEEEGRWPPAGTTACRAGQGQRLRTPRPPRDTQPSSLFPGEKWTWPSASCPGTELVSHGP